MPSSRTRRRWRLTGLLAFIILLNMLPAAVYGEGGDGSGNTPGVKPLALVSATLGDGTIIFGAESIPLQPKITMRFDKNVVHLIYWERNKRCFHLYDETGREAALKISKIDDTVDFSKRQYLWAEPAEPLSPGTGYKLYVAPELLAKNGESTLAMSTDNQGVTISFKTAGEKTTGPSPASTATPAADAKDANGAPEANTQAAGVKTGAGAGPVETDPPPGNTLAGSIAPTGAEPAESSTGAAPNRTHAAAPDGPAAPDREDAVKPASLRPDRQAQHCAAAAAGMILVGWVVIEIFRRKNSRG